MTKKLYKVECRGLKYNSTGSGVIHGISYVIAEDSTSAYNKVKRYLDINCIGLECERELLLIELIAEDYGYSATRTMLFL